MKRSLLILTSLFAIAALIVIWRINPPITKVAAERSLEKAWTTLGTPRSAASEKEAERLLRAIPDLDDARLLLAHAAALRNQLDSAAVMVQPISDRYVRENGKKILEFARLLQNQGAISDAEFILRRLIKVAPNTEAPQHQLLGILRITGRNREALPLIQTAMAKGQAMLPELLMAMAPRGHWASDVDRQFLQQFSSQIKRDPLIGMALAKMELVSGRPEQAEPILNDIVQQWPNQIDAQLLRGEVLMELARDDEYLAWESQLPTTAHDRPEVWVLRGLWERRQNRNATAARCFVEAAQRDPRNMTAHYQLSQVSKLLNHIKLSQAAGATADRMSRLHDLCVGFGKSMNPLLAKQIVDLLEELEWFAEALTCCRLSAGTWSELDWPKQRLAALEQSDNNHRLNANPPSALASQLDSSLWPLPERTITIRRTTEGQSPLVRKTSAIQFSEDARQIGIDFTFFNGAPKSKEQIAYMVEFSGAGVGVLDFDRDGWPDINLTQGMHWPVQASDHSHHDALYRNLGNGSFVEVGTLAGVNDTGYSQGPAVGDFDGDGFPDVYLGNVGPNRLFRNNGDGTFTDTTQESQTAGDDWTISAAMVDLNGDTMPDLYVVNYLEGDDVHNRLCFSGNRPVQCGPDLFPAAPDRVYLNLGDGRFRDITQEAGFTAANGKGMGLIAADLDGSRKLSVFVANDVTPNFLFQNQTSTPEKTQFEERGIAAGVAFDVYGRAQSSMGVAVADVNEDGLSDVFVTNFLNEYNNLFLQGAEGLFEDGARRAGLYEGDYLTEGWGTQFFDADADGLVDLFVANGHVQDLSIDKGRMPPHLFHNVGQGRFELLPTQSLGKYFQGKYLGRSVATWDWNRDGRMDLCVSHVDEPVAVLTNQTPTPHHWLSLKLVGVESCRDPIGTKVTVAAGTQVVTRQLTAGDGYAASNERGLSFGIQSDASTANITVDWISGRQQHFADILVDTEAILVEGRSHPIRLTRQPQ